MLRRNVLLLLAACVVSFTGCSSGTAIILPDQPYIAAISPASGVRGLDQVTITGLGFGANSAAGRVYFTASAAGRTPSQVPVVEAVVATETTDGVTRKLWTDTEIKVWVPALAATGPVVVSANGLESNKVDFTVSEPPPGTLLITGFTPASGPEGTAVVIDGENFGEEQGTSSVGIWVKKLGITSWSDTQIIGVIPIGASTATFSINVGVQTAESQAEFIVGDRPVITDVVPSVLVIGQPATIYGHDFLGIRGTLRIGSTLVTPSDWSDSRLEIDALPLIATIDNVDVPVVVTADNGLASVPYLVNLTTPVLEGVVTASPSAGLANSAAGADDGTLFTITTEVTGGTGPFEFTLVPDVAQPVVLGATASGASPATLTHYYDAPGTYTVGVVVLDTVGGGASLLTGPEITVLASNAVLVEEMHLATYSQAQNAPNPWCYILDAADHPLYSDFTFTPTEIAFSSALTEMAVVGGGTTDVVRDHASYLDGGTDPRPMGYRYPGADLQGAVLLRGSHFGTAAGRIWLNSTAPGVGFEVPPVDILSWTGTEIFFLLPDPAAQDLSGVLTVERFTGGSYTTSESLICSAAVETITPAGQLEATDTIEITGFDLTPPEVPGWVGDRTYLFWAIPAQYTDPWTTEVVTRLALIVEPFPVEVEAGGVVHFNLGQLTGQQQVEVFDTAAPPYTDSALVMAQAVPGNYEFFFWTGTLAAGTDEERANSGMFSGMSILPVGLPETYSISGHVQDDTAAPMAGVTINVTGGFSATTNASGDYTVAGLPAGNYTITPSMAGYYFAPVSRNVSLPPDATGLDFVATTGGDNITISGTVNETVGLAPGSPPMPIFEPLPGATVTLYPNGNYPPDSASIGTTTSDASGNFSFVVPILGMGTWYGIVVTHPSFPTPDLWEGNGFYPPDGWQDSSHIYATKYIAP